jgi:SAM-dependent methyltransferase
MRAMDIHRLKWNFYFGKKAKTPVVYDPWLDRYLDRLKAVKSEKVLDLGCGSGNNTKYLLEKDFSVIPADYSEKAIALIKRNFPHASPLVFDMRNRFPFDDGSLGAIVADLSIHYFDWETTLKILGEIERCLVPRGCFLCRVNSVHDFNYGAGKGKEIEKNYFSRRGERKRFFDEEAIDRLVGPAFQLIDKKETTMHRYGKEKRVWELGAMKNPDS